MKNNNTEKSDFLIARFIGQNGSMGFATGRKYELLVEKNNKTVRIISRGVVLPNDEMVVPYNSKEEFLRDWKIITKYES